MWTPSPPVVAALLFAPAVAVISGMLAWRHFKLAAKKARIMVKYVHRNASDQSHVLDLDPAFVARFESAPDHCSVMSLSSYLASLDFGGDVATAKAIVVTLLSAIGGRRAAALLPLVPLAPLPGQDLGPKASLLSRFIVGEFPSALLAAAMVDGGTAFFQTLARGGAESSGQPSEPPMDAMTLLYLGGAPNEVPALCSVPAHIARNAPLVAAVAAMDLGAMPDTAMVQRPEPFSSDLLPGLCLGMGGLVHQETPRSMACNRLLAATLNRLAANAYVYGHYTDSSGNPMHELRLRVGEDVVASPADFLSSVLRQGGGTLLARIRTNSTAFGLGLCVKLGSAGSCRDYAQIPLAFCMRTGATTTSGEAVHQLSQHSQIEWLITGNALLNPHGTVAAGFYTGIGGFTGFFAAGEWRRPWVLESALEVALSEAEAVRAMQLCQVVAVTANLTVREWNFPFGGYGGLGVCADSVAVVEKALRNETRLFPLVMRGDAKAAFIAIASGELTRSLEGHEQLTDALREIVVALIHLPNDIQIEPHEIISTLDRISACALPTPFWSDRKERARLEKVKVSWARVFEPFQDDLRAVGGVLNQKQEL